MSGNRVIKGRVETVIVFLLSPLLSIPFLLIQLRRGDRYVKIILSLLIGLLSFVYIPHFTNDKTRYFERYEHFKFIDFDGFLLHLVYTQRPDFIFEFFIFCFSKIGFNIQYLILLVSSFTFYSIYSFFENVFSYYKIERRWYKFIAPIVLVTLSVAALFSGIRFYLGTAFLLWAIDFMLLRKNTKIGILFLALSVSTHFSFSMFVPILLLYRFFPNNALLLKALLSVCLVLWFIPKDFLERFIDVLKLSESYKGKSEAYITDEVKRSENMLILMYIQNLWSYFAVIFLLLIKKNKITNYVKFIILSFVVIGITHPLIVVYARYMLVVKILFFSYLLVLKINKKIGKLPFYTLIVVAILGFLVDIITQRNNITASFQFENLATMYNILSTKLEIEDFIRD